MEVTLRKKYFDVLQEEIKELVDPLTGLLRDKYSSIINCPLCCASTKYHDILFIKNGYTFVRCSKCEMIFTNPQVKVELLNDLYAKSKSNDLWVEVQKSEKEKEWKRDYFIDCIGLLGKYARSKSIKLLDIGCSLGYFLYLLKSLKKNWDCKGIELNEKAFKIAIEKNLNVEKKFLHELHGNERFDIFTMFGVLEHLPDPQKILSDIITHSNIKKSSYVMAIVPNAYSLYHMFLQSKSVSFDGRNHLLYFSEVTLRRLFENNNFDVLYLDTVLSGVDNIKRQIQWFDSNENIDTMKYISKAIKPIFECGKIENFMFKYNLGLRLRIIARYKR